MGKIISIIKTHRHFGLTPYNSEAHVSGQVK